MPYDEAERFLQRIRTADDVPLVFSSDTDTQTTTTPASNLTTSVSSPSESSLAASSPRPFPMPAAPPKITLTTQPTSGPSLPSVVIPPQTAPLWAQADASSYFSRLFLPSAAATAAGVKSFYNSCGRLFHVFSPLQADEYYKAVFSADGQPDFSQKIAICCLCAIAAVGIQYNADDFEKGAEEVFHHVSRHFFTDVMEERPLEAIKVCALFAVYNMLDKATAALAYVGERGRYLD